MASIQLDIDKIVRIFREIVKRKTTYNETNLHYEYFKRAGDTIPYNTHGFTSLRDLIQKKAGDFFYFEKVAKDLEFIAPKRVDDASLCLNDSKASTPIFEVKKMEKNQLYDGSDAAKRVRVSNNIYFVQSQSTGLNNPFQNIRNDIKISFDFNTQKREVDRRDANGELANQSNSLVNDKQLTDGNHVHYGTYSLAQNEDERTDDVEQDDDFPWDDKYWHLKITHAASTNEIWARFFDKFEDRMRKMTAKLIKIISWNPKQEQIHAVKGLYVAKDQVNCVRVVVLKVEPTIKQCKCFLVDVGEVKWFDENQIFCCPSEYQNMRPLAMRFCLYGLIEFKGNRNSSKIVSKQLTNKEVWAKIKIKPNEFYKQTGKHQPIPVILYDSLERQSRTNVSAFIMEKMVSTFKPPMLSKSHTNYVTITHISKVTGNIYCHIINSSNDLKYVKSMIEVAVENGVHRCYDDFHSETDLHELLAINANKLHLIYSEYDRSWYRAKIVQLETNLYGSDENNIYSQCNVCCYLVDYGNTRVISLTNIYTLNGILAQYPALAVAMALDGVRMTHTKIDQLKTILLRGDDVFVDVIEMVNCDDSNKSKTVSLVTVKKLEKSAVNDETFLCNLNRILR